MKHILLFLCFAVANCQRNFQQFSEIKIGGLFYDYEFEIEEAFVKTIGIVNNRSETNFKLVPVCMRLRSNDGPTVIEKYACDLLHQGVAAIFGPSSKADSDIVSIISHFTGVPNILFDAINEESERQKAGHQLTLNVYPAQPILSKAYSDIVGNFGWKKFTIVYDADDDNAPIRLQDILQLKHIHNEGVRVRKFKRGDDFNVMWKGIEGERRVILDCPPDMLVEVLNASIPYDLTTTFNHLFLTNLETPPGILEPLLDNVTFAVNITAARLRSRENSINGGFNQSIVENTDVPTKKLLPDLIHDAVMLYYMALKNISSRYQITEPHGCRCDYLDYNPRTMRRWDLGVLTHRIMKMIAPQNDTYFRYSYIQFDDAGYRTNFTVELYEPMNNTGIAVWNTKGQISYEHSVRTEKKKVHYRVATRLGAPYFMKKKEAEEANITGNALYEGYAVDLIKHLSEEMHFDYTFVCVEKYGTYNKDNKRWDGIIGELLNNDAHMGICDLTITQARKEVVDFSVPFMTLGVSILAYHKPTEEKDWNAFLEPIQTEAWIYTLIAILVVAVAYLLLSRITMGDWGNPHPCNQNPDVVQNKWNLANSLYITVGSIMCAGCDILPTHLILRLFTAFFWIFAIIFNNSYVAGLSAAFTSTQMDSSIAGIDDLAGQAAVKFGTIKDGSTFNFFKESNETTYRLAFNRMQGADPPVYTKTNDEGVSRVLRTNGSYMFLMETTTLEYNTERNCKLRMVGPTFGEKHYAIAVPFDSSYRHQLNVAILALNEKGILPGLKTKWWKTNGTECYHEPIGDSEHRALTFNNVRGLFYTLIAGMVVAYIIGIADFLMYCQKLGAEEGILFKEAFIRELKFVVDIRNNKKRIVPAGSMRSASGGTDKSSKSEKSSTSDKSFRSEKSNKTYKSSKSHKSTKSIESSKTVQSQMTSPEDAPESKSKKSMKGFIINLSKRHKKS